MPRVRAAESGACLDDRGRPLRLADPRRVCRAAGRRSRDKAERRAFIGGIVVLGVVVVLTTWPLVLVVLIAVGLSGLWSVAGVLALLGLFWLARRWGAGPSFLGEFGPDDAEGFVRAALRVHRCPGCVYDLSTIAAQDDGCRVCPECGAAWRDRRPRPSPVPLVRPAPQPRRADGARSPRPRG